MKWAPPTAELAASGHLAGPGTGMLGFMRVELTGRQPLLRRDMRVSAAEEGQLVLDARRLIFASPLDLAAIARSPMLPRPSR